MRYVGGKALIAKDIAAVVREFNRPLVWEPFCGGLSVTCELAKNHDVIASDVRESLITLYRDFDAIQLPDYVSEADYRAARALPDNDPVKAFIGFGCSYGGRYFEGYARGTVARKPGVISPDANHAAIAKRGLERKLSACKNVMFECIDFLQVEPYTASDMLIYCDPPYVGTKGYGMHFDSAAFFARCKVWSSLGVPCLVSEYTEPNVPHILMWQKEISVSIARRVATDSVAVERLFLL